MDKRPMKELLKLLLIFITSHEREFSGMCLSTHRMVSRRITSKEEEDRMDRFILKHKPEDADIGYWWEAGLKEPRIEFLESEIAKFK